METFGLICMFTGAVLGLIGELKRPRAPVTLVDLLLRYKS